MAIAILNVHFLLLFFFIFEIAQSNRVGVAQHDYFVLLKI
jgi:hypothetical protein